MSPRAGDLRSFARIYAETETEGTLGSTRTTWGPTGTAWMRFLPSFLTVRNYGAGEATRGVREMEAHPGADVSERNGLAIEAGPEAGTRWRVLDVDEADPSTTRLTVEPYTGSFT